MAALARAVTANGLEPLSDPLTLLRFYRARNRDVKAAAQMYHSTLAWRTTIPELMDAFGTPGEYESNGGRATDPSAWSWSPHANSAEAELAYRHAFFTRLPHLPPILIWRAGLADYKGIVREELVNIMIKAFIVHLEAPWHHLSIHFSASGGFLTNARRPFHPKDALQASRAASFHEGELVRARLIIDCQGFGFENIRYLQILKRIITLGKSYYPEVAATVTVIRAPGFMATFYNLVKPLLPKLLQQKICILGADFHDGLMKHTGLDKTSLPDFLGGDVNVKFGDVLPVPENALQALEP